MSFLPAVQREIQNRQPNDVVRLTLEYLSQHAVGHQNPIPLDRIVAHLQAQGETLGSNNRFSPHQGVPIISSGLAAEDIF